MGGQRITYKCEMAPIPLLLGAQCSSPTQIRDTELNGSILRIGGIRCCRTKVRGILVLFCHVEW